MGRPPGTRKQREGRSVPGHKLSYASRKLFMIRTIPRLAGLKGFQSSMCITSYHPPMTDSNVPQDLVYLFFSCGWNVLFSSFFSTREFCSNVCALSTIQVAVRISSAKFPEGVINGDITYLHLHNFAMGLEGREYSPVPCTRDSAHKTFGPTDLKSTYSVRTRRVFGGIGHRTQAFRFGVRCSNPRLTTALMFKL
ncbi:hypothetical protein TNCV_1640211 [Trichonephila clavipes]|nr:hypothetical protein TNCV_1640211 [Trichonephila clavipes]